MATKQGMCKNCGSLIVFDDRNENCECIFCHCIVPCAEAVKILENPDDYTFANEEIEESADSTHYYMTKVNPDMIESAVARDKAMKSKEDQGSIKPSDFEISPNDVKAPTKLKAIVIGGAALIILLIVVIALPFYNSRKNLRDSIVLEMPTLSSVVKFDSSMDESGRTKGYKIYGQTCQNVKIAVSEKVTEDTCRQLFDKYTDIRASKAEIAQDKKNDGVMMEVFVSDGIYTITGKDGAVNVEYTADPVAETSATTESSK